MLGKTTLLTAAATFLLLTPDAARAADVSIHSVATNPSGFDHQTVTLEGTAIAVRETTSQRGNDYTTFKLQDSGSGDSVTVFTWGHPPLGNGDRVQVEAFSRENIIRVATRFTMR
jgi:hypothetical protein